MCVCVSGLKRIAEAEKVASPRIGEVTDAYEHALLGVYTRARYVVGRGAWFFWLPIQALPEWLGDNSESGKYTDLNLN